MRKLLLLFIVSSSLLSNQFSIKLSGELDDDLFIIKSSSNNTKLIEIKQMHNPSLKFKYDNNIYTSSHIPGTINFKKKFNSNKNNIYIVALANEREEIWSGRKIKHRTHYKSDALFVDNKILLPALMPEYNSVPDYPLWFNKENDCKYKACYERQVKGSSEQYNYYRLWENAIVQLGIIFPEPDEVEVFMYNNSGNLLYSYTSDITSTPKNLVSEKLKYNIVSGHPFAEVGNVLNLTKEQLPNKEFIDTMLINYKDEVYLIKMPYPFMYPNRLFAMSVK